ncbi:MAG: hypothetical protein RLZZ416_774 [Candidatus Parcubacteria bacterium]|jgi:hypothetical protein
MKTIFILSGVAAVLLIGGTLWSRSIAGSDPDVVSVAGIHWHPRLAIYVKGQQIEIPANIGIGPRFAGTSGYDPQMQMAAMHTHDDLPLIHLEFMSGPVRKEDATLGQFFKIWGKDMRSFGSSMRMTVNGKDNTEFENYVMHDGDRIELRFN